MNLGERVAAWADSEPSVKAVVLIGSRVRSDADVIWRADPHSDWDFQIIASDPKLFTDSRWTESLGIPLHTYVVRRAAIGGVPKVAALFQGVEADFVILPNRTLNLAKLAVGLGLHRRSERIKRGLQDLALIARPGWRFLKGGPTWEPFYRRVVNDLADARLDDQDVRRLADGFVCDARWVSRKIDRGEYLAAQRAIHTSLVETNFRLLHELKLRRRERSFPEARRAELIMSDVELAAVTVAATPDGVSLLQGLEKASLTCREFTKAMLGDAWRWPSL